MNNVKFSVCASSELDLFVRPPVQTSIMSTKYIEYKPSINHEKGSIPIMFTITGSKGEYVDLSNIFLYLKTSIVNANTGVKITDTDEVAPINYLLNTMFKQVDAVINQTNVSASCLYGYRSFIEAVLNYGKESKSTHLDSALWTKDTAGLMDELNFKEPVQQSSSGISITNPVQPTSTPTTSSPASTPSTTTQNQTTKMEIKRDLHENNEHRSKRVKRADSSTINKGLINRRNAFLNQTCELLGRLHLDICNIEKLLLDEMDIEIKLTKNDDKFCLIGKEGYRLEINEAVLIVRKVVISNDILVAHALALEKKNAFYPISRVDCQVKSITVGSSDVTFENVFSGPLPKRLVLGMVNSQAFNGDFSKNPFNFQHFDLSSLSVTIDGQNIPYPRYTFNHSINSLTFLRAYYSLFTTNDAIQHFGNDISIYEYHNGMFLIAYDLSPDGCINSDHFNKDKKGNFRIEMQFSKPTSHAISVILYSEFDNYFEVTKDRQVVYQYIG